MNHIPDVLWNEIKNLIPKKKSKVGRPEFDNKKTLEGIIYILHTGAQWNMLPDHYGCSTTVHGKFMKWCRLGVFQKIIVKAREYYRKRNSKNNWFAFDTISKKAPFAKFAGKNPTDRGKRGIKHTVLVDRQGAPLFVGVAAANRHDSKLFEPIVFQLKQSKNTRIIAADSAFDVKKLYLQCKQKNIALVASSNPRRDKNKHKFHAPYRWVVERTFGILSWSRGIKNCWNKSFEAASAFLNLACSIRLFKMSGIFG
jgi:putative transposase